MLIYQYLSIYSDGNNVTILFFSVINYYM
uniref:Uncharacterized protein n=1 Tax=Anguilla anguilla TaxID=7936 RepID=A0A0E9W665_ANGAN